VSEETRIVKTPDWGFWKDIEEVELWQAAFLANNIDPDSQRPLQRHYQPYNSRPRLPDGLHDEKVSKLLRKLIAKWQQGQFSSPPLVICSNSNFQRVNLSEVATCCIHMNYDIPQELVALGKKPDTSNVVKSESKPEVISEETQDNDKKLKILADDAACTIRSDNTPVTLNAVCKELMKMNVREKNRELLYGQKGWHTISWLKAKLKGWEDPILNK